MGAAVFQAAFRQQLRSMARDRRLLWLALALAVILAGALVSGASRERAWAAERAEAIAAEQRSWDGLAPMNPHGAAHFGRYVFKPVSPLAALDRGLLDHLGLALKLEAHNQNPARYRPADQGTTLSRFASFDAATAMGVLAPLLVLLASFNAFSGETARQLVRQELAQGASAWTLAAGRLSALALGIGLLLALYALAGVLALIAAGRLAAEWDALALIVLGQALYLLAFLCLGIAASLRFRSARTALVLLLGFWAVATMVVPRIAPALAERAHPTRSGPEFEAAVTEAVLKGVDGHDPRDARLAKLREDVLRRYGVTRVEDLPVNFNGIALAEGERYSTGIYREQLRTLYDGYEAQAAMARAFALLSPTMPLRAWSSALAGTDLNAHRDMLERAELHRYRIIQALNRDIILNRRNDDSDYLRDIAAITRGEDLSIPAVPLPAVIRRQRVDLGLLALWAGLALLLVRAGARRLERAA